MSHLIDPDDIDGPQRPSLRQSGLFRSLENIDTSVGFCVQEEQRTADARNALPCSL